MMISWAGISALGGVGVMLAAALAIAAWLIAGRLWRMALWWCLLFIGGMGLVVASKIAFIGWGVGIRSLDFTGFSGHSMRATAVMPVLLYLLLQNAPRRARSSGILLGMLFGVVIGVSRLVLHFHSFFDVFAGCVLGAIVSLTFIWFLDGSQKPPIYRSLITLSMMALFAMPHAVSVPTQRWMINVALFFSGNVKPFSYDSD